jgi:hypothetical protein
MVFPEDERVDEPFVTQPNGNVMAISKTIVIARLGQIAGIVDS